MPRGQSRTVIQRNPNLKTRKNISWLGFPLQFIRKMRNASPFPTDRGLYEVLEYESILELKDKLGENAYFCKREKVRYLQNSIIAYQDQAWGDGDILLNYRCTPGTPVDRYRPGNRTYILISLRNVRNKGDIDEFKIEWGIHKGFLRPSELWETDVSHPTRQMTIQIVFPKMRPPTRVGLIESNLRKTTSLSQEGISQYPDGRWLVKWETQSVRLNEKYIIEWDW